MVNAAVNVPFRLSGPAYRNATPLRVFSITTRFLVHKATLLVKEIYKPMIISVVRGGEVEK